MIRYITNRLLSAVGVIILVSILVFTIIRLIPGDPISILLGDNLTEDARVRLVEKWGLDQPVFIQYLRWAGRMAVGDFGASIRTQDSVSSLLLDRIPATLSLAVISLAIAVLIGIPAGVIAAYRANTLTDGVAMLTALLGLCIPSFWLSLLLILLFSIKLHWLPVSGYVSPFTSISEWFSHIIMPSLALGAGLAASISRMTRSAMLDALNQDYVRTARAKGLDERVTLFAHALKNALLPIITVVGLQLGFLLGGAVVVEEVFAIPGIGRLLIFGISNRDYPLIQGVVMVFAVSFILINLMVDMLYSVFDPRIRYR
ncbi:MAG TPA: ABC transporter permease [Thermomicrobiales bacterium]|nr:ABC transporter permease [Thermomicrobiales bacterium]